MTKRKNLLPITIIVTLVISLLLPSERADAKTYEQGITIDIARHHYSLAALKSIVKEISTYKGRYLQLHFSDDENYAIASKYLKQNSTKVNNQYLTAGEIQALIRYANERNVQIIPDFDIPAHSKAWTKQLPASTRKKVLSDFDNSLVDYFGSKTAVTVSQKMLKEIMATFDQPKYRSSARIVIGGDEVAGAGNYQEDFIQFMNQMADYTVKNGYRPMMWNDSITSSGLKTLNKKVIILYWGQNSTDQLTARAFTKAKFHVYNYNKDALYFLPAFTFDDQFIVNHGNYIKEAYKLNSFNHVDNAATIVESTYIDGASLNFWSEHADGMTTDQMVTQIKPLIKNFLQQ